MRNDQPGEFRQVSLREAALCELGLDRAYMDRGRLVVPTGQAACLTTAGNTSAIPPLVLQLESITQVRALFGFAGDHFERGYLSPFELAVYAGCELVIEPGARLDVTGKPACLIFEHVDIRRGGQLVVYVPFNLTADVLRCNDGDDSIRSIVGEKDKVPWTTSRLTHSIW
jgi:hypothetical protein